MVKKQKPLEDVISKRLAHSHYDALFQLWEKALARLDDDRDGAITAARSLIETTIKLALDEMHVQYRELGLAEAVLRTCYRARAFAEAAHGQSISISVWGSAKRRE
jgi:hypothetical protein